MSLENTSSRGVLAHYGPRGVDETHGGETAGESGIERVVEYLFDYNDLPAYGATNLEHVIPAGARVTSAVWETIVAFTSTATTTDVLVGLWQDDNGATYDADGLLTAVNLESAVTATLVRVIGTGAVVNGVPLTEACQVYALPDVDDLLTGKARLTVSYTMKAVEKALY